MTKKANTNVIIRLQLQKIVSIDGTALDAHVYIARWNDVCMLGVASSGGTRKPDCPSSNPDRTIALETVIQRLRDMNVRDIVAYKLDIPKSLLFVDTHIEIECDDLQKPSFPYKRASFAFTFEGMTECEIEYLLTGEVQKFTENGAVPLYMLSASEHRKKDFIERVRRSRKAALEAKEHYAAKCMVPDCNLEIWQENGIPYVEVHHLKSVSEHGSDNLENLVVLCPHHHAEIHHASIERREKLKKQILEKRKKQFGM